MKGRWGRYSRSKMKNNSLANRNKGTMPHVCCSAESANQRRSCKYMFFLVLNLLP